MKKKLNPHMWMTAVDPPGAVGRRWECQYCKAVGRLSYLQTKECTFTYPPCKVCGQTPECAKDCGGVKGALAAVVILNAAGREKPS
jgi:hypothetical protein